jgi:hypothetical protein
MDLKRFQKLLHDAIRKEKEENGRDVRGYKVVYIDIDGITPVRFHIDHERHEVKIVD